MAKRKIVNIDEALCNGCGSCVPNCAEGALRIVDGKARIVKEVYCDGLGACLGHCPKGAITVVEKDAPEFDEKAVHAYLSAVKVEAGAKPVVQWPVKLNLVPLQAPFYDGAHLLVAADCVPVALRNLHGTLLAGMRIVIGCSKFDDAKAYAEKLGEIFKRNNIADVTVVHMEVPCCSGLKCAVDTAVKASGKPIPVKRLIVTVGGEVREQ
jgi:NAD-dependent dihydropyrimidine dehydrogenase PreA subunit